MRGNLFSIPHLHRLLGRSTWFEKAIFVLIVLGAAVALTPNSADPDLWGHVRYGQDTLRHGLLNTCTYSYTSEGFRWVNHEILSECCFAYLVDSFGPLSLLYVKCALGLLIVGSIIYIAIRQGAGLITVCVTCLLVAVSLSYHWSIRPQIFTYILFAVMIGVVTYCFDGWSGRWHLRWPRTTETSQAPPKLEFRRLKWLWLMPVVMAFATNFHGGFIAIYCVFAAYLGVRSIEALNVLGHQAWPFIRHFAAVLAVSALATLVNPYGFQLHTWLLMDLSIPRPEILEWHRPDFSSSHTIPLILLLGAVVATLIHSRQRHDATHLAVLGCCLWQTLEHLRHVPFFAIPFGFWFANHIESVLQRFGLSKPESSLGDDMSPRMQRVFAGALLVAALLVGWRLTDRLSDLTVNRDEYPVAAFQFISDRGLHGKMVCTFNWAQYALAAFGPQEPGQTGILIHSDGRLRTCYPQETLDELFDFIIGDHPEMRQRSPNSPPLNGSKILEVGNPDLVLLDRGQGPSRDVMQANSSKWSLLYRDSIAELWGRASVFDIPESSQHLPAELRSVDDTRQHGTASWPAFPTNYWRNVKLSKTPPQESCDD